MTDLEIEKYLQSHNVYPETVECLGTADDDAIRVVVEGDWKHDLLYTQDLMEQAGYRLYSREQLDDTGCDWGTEEQIYLPKDSHVFRVMDFLIRNAQH